MSAAYFVLRARDGRGYYARVDAPWGLVGGWFVAERLGLAHRFASRAEAEEVQARLSWGLQFEGAVEEVARG